MKMEVITCHDRFVSTEENCIDHEENSKVHVHHTPKTSFDLTSTDLTRIPGEVLDTVNVCITRLYLDYNDITDFPADLCTKLPNLEVLTANGNQLQTLPDTIGCLQCLREFELGDNDLKTLPASVGKLKFLQSLRLMGNKLTSLPDSFTSLISLRNLIVEENELTEFPPDLGKLRELRVLEASNNQLTSIPDSIGDLEHLQIINISKNDISVIPDSLGLLTNLENVDLSMNGIEYLPAQCNSTNTLKKFYVDCNLLKVLPDWINRLPEITELSVKDNHCSYSAFTENFGDVSRKLRILDIGGNFITELPESFGNLELLEEFHMGSVIDELERRNFQNGNWIAHLPSSFSCLTRLTEIHMDENQIRELPDDFGNLVLLEFFDIGQNMLHRLPDSFCNLKRLRVCQLSKNSIEYLPNDIGNLESLEDLRMDNNMITELPESFSRLANLKSLDMFNNKLKKIPPPIHSLKNLVRLDMGENDFSIPWHEVPHLIVNNRYAPRNPKLKDNWRGKVRPDVNYDNTLSKKIVVEASDLPEVEEVVEEPIYNDFVMKRAAERSLSFWRSHDGPQIQRPTFKRPTNGFHLFKPRPQLWSNRGKEKEEADKADSDGELSAGGISSEEEEEKKGGSKDWPIRKNGHYHVKDEDDECDESSEEEREEEDLEENVLTGSESEEDDEEDEDEENDNESCSSETACKEALNIQTYPGIEENTMKAQEEDWDEEIENSLGPYDEIKVYHHPPRDQMIITQEIRSHFFPAWDIHTRPIQWHDLQPIHDVEEGQFDDTDD